MQANSSVIGYYSSWQCYRTNEKDKCLLNSIYTLGVFFLFSEYSSQYFSWFCILNEFYCIITAPTDVNNLDVFRINGSALVVAWNTPTNENFKHGHLQGFAVYTYNFYTANCTYNRTNYNVSDPILTPFNPSYNYSLLVRGLRPCTDYSFAVRAITNDVEGVVSQTVSRGTGIRSMP